MRGGQHGLDWAVKGFVAGKPTLMTLRLLRETSQQDCMEARAIELDLLGWHRWAEDVRYCGQATYPGRRARFCRHRCCPRCEEYLSMEHRKTKGAARRAMDGIDHRVLITRRSDGIRHLRGTIEAFRRDFERLRGRKLFSVVNGGVGRLEVKPTRGLDAWVPHVHFCLMCARKLTRNDIAAFDAAWKGLIGSDRGEVKMLEEQCRPSKRNAYGADTYEVKAEGLCPRPGSFGAGSGALDAPDQEGDGGSAARTWATTDIETHLELLRELFSGLHGARSWFEWGRKDRHRTPRQVPVSDGQRLPDWFLCSNEPR